MTRYPGRSTGIGERPPLPNVLPVPASLGTPITEPTAVALRQVVFGQCPSMIRSEFFSRGPGMVFREAEQQLAYGLTFIGGDMTPMARSVLMIVQAQILKTLLFETDPARILKSRRDPLEPTMTIQKEALVAAVSEIIWRAGSGQGILCLPSKSLIHVPESPQFNHDGVTEKLQLVPFAKWDELVTVLRRYIYIFQEEPGPAVLLLLYSAVLSRGLDRVNEDLMGRAANFSGLTHRSHLVNFKGSISNSVLCLLMTGRATQFLHNGIQYRGDEDNASIAETGLLIRSPLGLLLWMGNEEKTQATNLGSRLKTPIFPIWLVICCDQSGLLFCLDRALMRDYRNEYNFQLHYYTSSHFQTGDTILNVCTRGFDETEPEIPLSTLDKIIRTKWSGARINWNGIVPYL
ncbi:hypothetical protein GHT06_018246 [Daphnia sinensis]|uniref:Ubiquitin carboxyl-terminal hydrolase MINDY n=1 Tax=Daphnia sinensis TaxID=1820382 RepID=A0AAD5L473_9CRUS|nr:hypothetical protein GHT06_018246 [Daphnia sinensis]